MWQVLDLLKKVDLNMLKAGILEQLRPSLSLSLFLSHFLLVLQISSEMSFPLLT